MFHFILRCRLKRSERKVSSEWDTSFIGRGDFYAMYDHKFPFRARRLFKMAWRRDCKTRYFSSLPLPNHEIRVPFTTRGILHVVAAYDCTRVCTHNLLPLSRVKYTRDVDASEFLSFSRAYTSEVQIKLLWAG